jgi:hypothetical protein
MSYQSYGELTPLLGGALRFTANIVDVNGDPVNPDTVAIGWRCQGQPVIGPFTWTNPPGSDPSNNVVYSGTVGSFYCDYTLPNAGVWTYQWDCQPSSGADTTATSAIIEGEITVSQPVV